MTNIFGLIYLIGYFISLLFAVVCAYLGLNLFHCQFILFSKKGLQLKWTVWFLVHIIPTHFPWTITRSSNKSKILDHSWKGQCSNCHFTPDSMQITQWQQRYDNVGLKPKGCVCHQATTTRRVSTLLHESQFGGSNSGLKQARPWKWTFLCVLTVAQNLLEVSSCVILFVGEAGQAMFVGLPC